MGRRGGGSHLLDAALDLQVDSRLLLGLGVHGCLVPSHHRFSWVLQALGLVEDVIEVGCV